MAAADSGKYILVTGATGKVGRNFLERVLDSPNHRDVRVRALCHNRTLAPRDRLDVVQGNVSDGARCARPWRESLTPSLRNVQGNS
jgi:nucleoside-diphosphate-sugar epimerase